MDGTSKAVLMTLADIADASGDAYPSIETLSTRTCFHRASVIRAIKTLETLGYVVANRENGRHTRYQINIKPVAQSNRLHAATGSTEQHNPSHSATKAVAQSDTNHHKPSITTISESESLKTDIFERVWNFYGHKLGKKLAHRAWKSLKIQKEDTRVPAMRKAMETLHLSRGWREGYKPHLSTWLNGERWNDEITAPVEIPHGGMEARNESQKVAI